MHLLGCLSGHIPPVLPDMPNGHTPDRYKAQSWELMPAPGAGESPTLSLAGRLVTELGSGGGTGVLISLRVLTLVYYSRRGQLRGTWLTRHFVISVISNG